MDLKQAINFEEYLNQCTTEQKNEMLSFLNNITLSKESVEYIKSIVEELNLLVFSESYCPDCIITLPLIKKICDLNNKINIYIFKRVGNEQLLIDMVGEARIPTVIALNSKMEPKGFYVEFPQELKNKFIGLKEEQRKEIINDFRKGKYLNLIEKEILNLIKAACC